MNNSTLQFLAILYRSSHLYKQAIVFALIIIGWGFGNLFANDATADNNADIPLDIMVIVYVLLITLQFQGMFAHGFVDDRDSKFRSIYSIMGLKNSNYLLAQYCAFVLIQVITATLFFIILLIYKFFMKNYEDGLINAPLIYSFFQSYVVIIQASAFTITLSYLFKTPTIARDVTFVVQFVTFFMVLYLQVHKNYQFLKYFLPYFTTCDYILNDIMQGIMGEMPSEDDQQNDKGNQYLSKILLSFIQIFINVIAFHYIDNIYPTGDDNQKDWLYFLDFFKLRKNNKDINEIKKFLEKDALDVEDKKEDNVDLKVMKLGKKFGNFSALKDIDMKLNKGSLYSLLGHNGAGKSTFVNILTGILKPTSGQVTWKGKDFRTLKRNLVESDDIRIGICPSYNCLQPSLTVYQHLKVAGMIKNVPNLEVKIQQVENLLNIKQYEKFQVQKLSGGNKRKLSLGISIIGNENLIFLDEPTSSIDPVSRKEIWDILLTLKEDPNRIIILTTHHLEEAELLSDEISVLSFGKIVAQGTVDQIKKQFGVGYQIEIFPKSGIKEFESELQDIYDTLQDKFEDQIQKQLTTRKIIISLEDSNVQIVKKVLKFLEKQNYKNFDINMNSNTLEKAFLEIDKQQHKEVDYETQGFQDFMIKELYQYQKPSSFRKVMMISFNKIWLFCSDIKELIKTIVVYAIICYCFWVVLYLIHSEFPLFTSMANSFLFILFIILELGLFSFSAYNFVYDNSNDIKTLLHANKVTILEYYLGKLLADVIINFFIYIAMFVALYKVFRNFESPSSFETLLYTNMIKIYFWKISFCSLSYLIGKLFDEPKQVLKYFSLIYSAYFGLLCLVNVVISKYIYTTAILMKVTDLFWILQVQSNKEYTLKYTFFTFLIFIIIYSFIFIYIEGFQMNFNYMYNSFQQSPKRKVEKIQDQIGSNILIDQNDSVDNEEKETHANKQIFFRALNLYKHYKKILFFGKEKIAVRNITFGIENKMSFGLVGPNGAGKSTTFNMILNKVLKSGGNLKFKNSKFQTQSLQKIFQKNIFQKNNFGVSFQGNALWENMNAKRNLLFYAKLNCVNQKMLMQLVKFFDFETYLKKKVSELSSGNKRKLCILISILNNPNIMLYDEATCGVDIMIRLKLKVMLDYLKRKNNTISIFTTHFLKDIEIFCDKLGLIKSGEFICVDYIENIKQQLGGYLIRLQQLDTNKKSQVEIMLKEQGDLKSARTISVSGVTHHQYFLYNKKKLLSLYDILLQLKSQEFIKDFSLNQLSIEDIYLNLLNEEENM